MNGLVFLEHARVAPSAPNRADVALFVGFVRRRPGVAAPSAVASWLGEQGWIDGPYARPAVDIHELLDVPVPIDAWDQFDSLFAWEQRLLSVDVPDSTYLGAAVRSFFAQGGRRCYVVRVGDPWAPATPRATRIAKTRLLVPGYPYMFSCSPTDRSRWSGIGHLFGLPDVSFVCVPDLPDAVASDPEPVILAPPPAVPGVEQWVECSATSISTPAASDQALSQWSAPRCRDAHYPDWTRAVSLIASQLSTTAREVQLVAAVPIPYGGTAAGRDLLAFLLGDGSGPLTALPQDRGLASAFIQLAYPWVRTSGSTDLPEQLESPDGVLVGVLARSALVKGAFHSAARQPLIDVYDIQPRLSRDQMLTLHSDSLAETAASHTLVQRVSLLGELPDGLCVLSDVTTSKQEAYRPASVGRLIAAIARAARRFGEESVFEASGPPVWNRLQQQLSGLLLGLFNDGALDGDTPGQAFQVRCDRSTMTQNDLDNGRVVAEVVLRAAMPVQGIRLMLALDAAGGLSLAPATTGVAA